MRTRYRVSPFTYLIDGMLSTAVAHTTVTCATNEYLHFSAPSGQTCAEYMKPYIASLGGYLEDPAAASNCSFCQIADTDTFLASVSSHPQYMWRNFGLMWVYIFFNVVGAVFLYWLIRVPKKKSGGKKELASPEGSKEGSILEGPETTHLGDKDSATNGPAGTTTEPEAAQGARQEKDDGVIR